MRDRDLADSSLASCHPDIADGIDSLADKLREALAPFIPAPDRPRAFAAVTTLLAGVPEPGLHLDREQIAHAILRAVYGDTSHEPSVRIIAAAALKRFGKDPRSYQAMGDEFGVTRACVQAHSRRIERRTGIKCRADKQESARRKSAARARARQRAKDPDIFRRRVP